MYSLVDGLKDFEGFDSTFIIVSIDVMDFYY